MHPHAIVIQQRLQEKQENTILPPPKKIRYPRISSPEPGLAIHQRAWQNVVFKPRMCLFHMLSASCAPGTAYTEDEEVCKCVCVCLYPGAVIPNLMTIAYPQVRSGEKGKCYLEPAKRLREEEQVNVPRLGNNGSPTPYAELERSERVQQRQKGGALPIGPLIQPTGPLTLYVAKVIPRLGARKGLYCSTLWVQVWPL